MNVKEYARALYNLTKTSGSLKELEEKVEGFLLYVRGENDTHLLKRIYGEFEKEWMKKEGVSNIRVETGKEDAEDEARLARLVDGLEKKGKTARVTKIINPELISGARIIVDDNYLVEASLHGALRQMFSI